MKYIYLILCLFIAFWVEAIRRRLSKSCSFHFVLFRGIGVVRSECMNLVELRGYFVNKFMKSLTVPRKSTITVNDLTKILLSTSLVLLTASAFGQTNGDYKSRQTGDWNSITTWQVFNSGWNNLESAGAGIYQNIIPSNSSGAIGIEASTTVSISSLSVTADQLTVNNSAALVVLGGGELIVADGTGDDLFITAQLSTVDINDNPIILPAGTCTVQNLGILDSQGQINNNQLQSSPSNLTIQGVYEHNQGGGVVPSAMWSNGSAVKVIGAITSTNGPITGINQTFYDFIWNPISQVGNRTLVTSTNPGLTSINHNFEVQNTDASGGNSVFLTASSATNTTVIQGDLVISGNSKFYMSFTTNTTVTVNGNVRISSTLTGTSLVITQTATSPKLTVFQDFLITGTSDVDLSEGNGGVGSLDLYGDLDFDRGTILVTSTTSSSNLTFHKTGIQNLRRNVDNSGGFVSGRLNYTINSTSQTNLGEIPLVGSGILTVNGKIGVGSTHINGAVQNTTTAGNIQVPLANRLYTAAGIIYNGSALQRIGDIPSGVNLEIANVNNVTNNNSGITNVVTDLRLTAGALNIGTGNTLNIQSNFITSGGGTIGGDPTSNLTFSSSAITTETLSFAPGTEFLNNLTMDRAGDLVLGSNLTVGGTINLSSGNLDFSGHTLTMNGGSIPGSKGLKSNNSSNLVFGGSTYSGLIPFSGTNNQLNNLTFSTNNGVYTWNSTVTVNTAMTLSLGALTNSSGLTMAGNSTIFMDGGSFSGINPVAPSSYNVTYSANGNTGVELPATATGLNNLTIGSSGPVTLTSAITVNGILTLSGGTFAAGSNAITLKGNFVSNSSSTLTSSVITFSGTTALTGNITPIFGDVAIAASSSFTPQANFQINGNLANNGTLNAGTATTTFGGTTTISGSSTSSFNNIIISSTKTLTAPSAASFNVAGTFTDNGNFINNNGTVVFNGSSSITGSAVPNFAGITISSTGTLTAPATLNVAKNFTNNGTFNRGTGTVVFNGVTAQSILGSNTTFNNITSSNASTVTVSTAQSLKGALTLTTGEFKANGNLTLISDASGDASIAQITGGTITGNIIAQRYLPNGNSTKAYRYLASPVTNAFASDWKADFPITGTFSDPSTQAEWPAITPFVQTDQSLLTYREAHTPTTTINDRYESFPPNGSTSTTTALVNGKGYAGYVRFASAYTNNLTGAPAQGAVPVVVTNQSGSTAGNDGWNLIGNPYAAPISWGSVAPSLPGGVGNAIYLLDNTNNVGCGSGVFVSYVGGVGTCGYTGTISSGQAFWVRATTTSTITFQESHKQAIATPQFIRTGSMPDILRVDLSGNNKMDEIVIRFVQDGNDAGDVHYDAFKMNNLPSFSMDGQKLSQSINLSSLSSDGQKMAINGMGPLDCSKQVPLIVEDVTAGAYIFKFSQLESFSNDVQIQLFDAFTGTSVKVDHADSVYNFTVTSDPASFGTNRFKVSFSRGPVPTSFALATSNACKGTDGLVSVGTSQVGVSYFLKMNGNQIGQSLTGNGGSLSFSIPPDSLSVGINPVEVWAQSASCSTATYSQKDSIQVVGVFRVTQVSSTTSCKAGSVTLTANGAPADGRYNWYETIDEIQPITGQSQSIFTTPVLAKTKTFYVAAVNAAGCEGERIPIRATVVNFDDAVMTQLDETTIQSNYSFGNQWYFNDQLLGDTTAILKMESSGVYRLEVKIGGGCTTSDERTFVVTGMELDFNGIKSYPNPVRGVYTVETLDKENQIAEMPIFDALGGQIGTMKLTSQGNLKRGQFDFSAHSSGLYYIRVIRGDNVSVLKVIKN
jgi:hypothetical protein